MKVKGCLRLIYSKIKVDKETGCWVWAGYCFNYPLINLKDSKVYVHHLVYTWFKSPRTKGLQLHHTCENKKCVNPIHLEELTVGKHNATKDINYHNAGKTHCKRGHEFTEENTYIYRNGKSRVCKTCSKEYYQSHAEGIKNAKRILSKR